MTMNNNCFICCVEQESSTMCVLSRCSHSGCRECLKKWMEILELRSDDGSTPECPFCRKDVAKEDVLAILGRPFRTESSKEMPLGRHSADNNDDDIDELTQQWMREHTKSCPGCRVYIEKSTGCNRMKCLCGTRFCYGCGRARGRESGPERCTCGARNEFCGRCGCGHGRAAYRRRCYCYFRDMVIVDWTRTPRNTAS